MNKHQMLQIVAYQPDIAQNLGNIIRTAACFGAGIGVIEPAGFPFSIKSLRRAAMDYAEYVDIRRFDSWDHYLAASPARKVLLTTKSSLSYVKFRFLPGDDIIVGRESAGVPDTVAAQVDHMVTIPMPGKGRSLNVSNAAAIVVAEAIRQMSYA